MITFHPQRLDCAWHTRKNEYARTFNFTSQIASSICTSAFTKREKSDVIIFTSRCSRLSLVCIFRQGHALPLSFVRFLRLANSSSKIQRSLARRSRIIPQDIRQNVSRHGRATARQWRGSGSSNAVERSSRRLARQLALRRTWTRNVRAGNLRDNSQHGRATAVP